MYIQKILSPLIKLPNKRIVIFSAPKRFHWNKDYKPGMFPRTHEDRKIAAAKYNLHIDDYQTFPTEDYFGDYPNLPEICDASKDEYYPYDYPELKRNFNEPLHIDCDLFGEDRYDIDKYYQLRPSFMIQLLQFLAAFGSFAALMWVFEYCKMFPATLPKQFPHQGKTHYTFNIKKDEDTNTSDDSVDASKGTC